MKIVLARTAKTVRWDGDFEEKIYYATAAPSVLEGSLFDDTKIQGAS